MENIKIIYFKLYKFIVGEKIPKKLDKYGAHLMASAIFFMTPYYFIGLILHLFGMSINDYFINIFVYDTILDKLISFIAIIALVLIAKLLVKINPS